MNAQRGIVVGVDGSLGADAALAWAADEAHRRGSGLLVAHVGDEPDLATLSPATAAAVTSDIAGHAGWLLTAAAATVASRRPSVEVTTVLRPGNSVEKLVELSDRAELVVLGRRGAHTRFDALLGGVSHRVAAYARCPVVVVPNLAQAWAGEQATVAVAVGRSSGAMSALEAGFQHAQRQRARVLAVRAWGEVDWVHSMSMYTAESAERWRLASQHLLDRCIHRVASNYPSVSVDARLIRGQTITALQDAALEADLLLIGGRHRDDLRMSRLGWTATVLLAQAPCPVEVASGIPLRPADGDLVRAANLANTGRHEDSGVTWQR